MNIDETVLVLFKTMCEQSLDPDQFSEFEKIHDALIDVRGLHALKYELGVSSVDVCAETTT